MTPKTASCQPGISVTTTNTMRSPAVNVMLRCSPHATFSRQRRHWLAFGCRWHQHNFGRAPSFRRRAMSMRSKSATVGAQPCLRSRMLKSTHRSADNDTRRPTPLRIDRICCTDPRWRAKHATITGPSAPDEPVQRWPTLAFRWPDTGDLGVRSSRTAQWSAGRRPRHAR